MVSVIDYTKMRKGTRTRGSYRIDYCPECGRKGELQPAHIDRAGYGWPTSVIHKTEQRGGFNYVIDHCTCDDCPRRTS